MRDISFGSMERFTFLRVRWQRPGLLAALLISLACGPEPPLIDGTWDGGPWGESDTLLVILESTTESPTANVVGFIEVGGIFSGPVEGTYQYPRVSFRIVVLRDEVHDGNLRFDGTMESTGTEMTGTLLNRAGDRRPLRLQRIDQ